MSELSRLLIWLVLAVLEPDSYSRARLLSYDVVTPGDLPNARLAISSEWGRAVFSVALFGRGPHFPRRGLRYWAGIPGPDTYSFGTGLAAETRWTIGGDVMFKGLAVSVPYWFVYSMTLL